METKGKFIDDIKNIANNDKFELVNYIVLTILLFGSCFVVFFAWVAMFYVAILSIFFNHNRLLKLIVYLSSFKLCMFATIQNSQLNLKNIATMFLILSFGIKFLIQLIRKEKRITLKVFIPAIIFVIYLGLMCLRGFRLIVLLDFLMIVFSLYFLYEYRDEININEVVVSLSFGLIISSTFSLCGFFSSRIDGMLVEGSIYGVKKLAGMFSNPNHWVLYGLTAICGLLYLKVNKKISSILFFALLIPLIIFGNYTVSRNFTFCFIFASSLFLLFYLIKYKKEAWKFIGIFSVLICLVAIVFFNPSRANLVRLGILPESIYGTDYANENKQIEESELPPEKSFEEDDVFRQLVFDGLIEFDPGRVEIWKLYLTKISGQATNILIGNGIDSPDIGQRVAHNFFLQTTYYVGTVGLLILFWLVLSLIDWKSLKKINSQYTKLIFLLVCGLMMMVESCLGNFAMFILIALILVDNNIYKKDDGRICKIGNREIESHEKQ